MSMRIDALFCDLLSDLGLTYDDLDWSPLDNSSTVAKKVLASSFLKKFQDQVEETKTNKAALDKFLSINERCGSWQLKVETLRDEILLGTFQKWCHLVFQNGNRVDPLINSDFHILTNARLGPGASIDTKGSNSFYSKLFDSSLSSTSVDLYHGYVNFTRQFPLWAEAEKTRSTLRGRSRIVAGNRLSFVPKDVTTSRTICTEPVLNMFYQLGIGSILTTQLKRIFNIDLDVQPTVNRSLARRYSLDGSGVTIDLSSASDSMSLEMIKWAVGSSLFGYLEGTRSSHTRIDGVGDVQLNMVSTMGNGFTFPLQTLLFCCVVAASYEVDELPRIDNPRLHPLTGARCILDPDADWGVFGDDIVVPKRVTSNVLRLLHLLGFQTNGNKTFVEGPFRESCGYDAFLGYNVRGVYCKTLKTTQDVYSLINRLNDWSMRHGIPLPRTVSRLLKEVPRIVVPPWENDDCGVRLPYRVANMVINIKRSRGLFSYRRFVPRRSFLSVPIACNVVRTPGWLPPSGFNAAGLELTFIAGYMEGGSTSPQASGEPLCGAIPIKPEIVRYSLKTGRIPSWDFHPTVQTPFIGSGGGVLEIRTLLTNVSTW